MHHLIVALLLSVHLIFRILRYRKKYGSGSGSNPDGLPPDAAEK